MSVFAIVHPSGLVGQELRELLDQNQESWSDLRLLATDETEVGTLTEVRGRAAIVQRLEEDSLRGVDVLFLCGDAASSRPLVSQVDPATVVVMMSADATIEDALPVVHGVSPAEAVRGTSRVFLSPDPGVVLVAHLVAPLLPLGLVAAQATLTVPASTRDREGLDELFNQSRAIIAMVEQRPTTIFGRQLAFNLYPDERPPGLLTPQLRAVLGTAVPVVARSLQTAVFHGIGASLHLSFESDPGGAALRDALTLSGPVTVFDDDAPPSPIDTPMRQDIQIAEPQPDGAGGYWLWAVTDNLTRGGAVNALGIAQVALGR
jgi:aspartate-semialdehyde dehydrogenase